MLKMFGEAHNSCFTRENIMNRFRRSGSWPCDEGQLRKKPLSNDANDLEKIVTSEELRDKVC